MYVKIPTLRPHYSTGILCLSTLLAKKLCGRIQTVIMLWKVLVVAIFMAFVYSAPLPFPESPRSYSKEPGMPFDFAYSVKDDYTGNVFGHAAHSDGIVTSGSYRVLLPDGRTQVVTFSADPHNGYQAEVTYEGEAIYSVPKLSIYL
ncbi:cuticle protein 7 [Penaeus vannamei]|nr:cuticle protein 7-like [Penaeus vannamei]